MQVQINHHDSVADRALDVAAAETRLRERLARFGERLTRVELHAKDIDGTTNGDNGIEVTIEARPAGEAPLAVSERSRTIDTAFNGALSTLVERLDRNFGKADRVR